jgi:glycosyltransferase involved in cell wall biosynthesis
MCGKKTLQSPLSIEIPKTRFSRVGERHPNKLTSQLGLLAEPENVDDFRSGIVQLLEDDSLRHSINVNSRKTIVSDFSEKLIVSKHIELYKKS